MTTVAQIVTDAYQANNLLAVNAIPTAAEQDRGVRTLNRIFSGLMGNEIGEPLQNINIGANNIDSRVAPSATNISNRDDLSTYPTNYPGRNVRIVLNLQAATTIYLPPNPKAGARFAIVDKSANLATYPLTVIANGNTIGDVTSVVLNTSSTQSEWFFRADTGNWQKVSTLVLADTFPLPTEFEEFFVYLLSLRLTAAENIAFDSQSEYIIKQATRKLRARYRQGSEMPVERGLFVLPSNMISGGFGLQGVFNFA